MSFIEKMKSDVWTEQDIIAYTEAQILSAFPTALQAIINRKALSATLGAYTMTEQDLAEQAAFGACCLHWQQQAAQARIDMSALQLVLDVEAAARRLLIDPVTEPETVTVYDEDGTESQVPNPAIAVDVEERAAAQSVIDAASLETLALVELRRLPDLAPDAIDEVIVE